MNIVWISKIEWDMPHKTSRLKLSEALRKRGHTVTLYMAKKFGEKKFVSDNIIGVPTIHYPILSGIFFGLIVFFLFPVILKRKKVDIIVIDFTKIWLPFIISLKILNKPIILDIRTLPIDKDVTFSFKLLLALSRYVADGITTITPELKKILHDDFNLINIKIGVWCSGVSVDDFNDVTINTKSVIKGVSKDNKFILMYHGDYSPTRGIENLIKAISELDPSLKDKIKLFIIGMPENQI